MAKGQRLDWDTILQLRDKEKLSYRQIGARLSVSPGSVEKAYKRAKELQADPNAPYKRKGSKPGVYQIGKLPSKPTPEEGKPPKDAESKPTVYSEGKPEVYYDSKLESLLPDLEEMVSWWRERKQALSKPTVLPDQTADLHSI